MCLYIIYTQSSQILGFDIILREDMEPFLLEVNHSPSFHTPSEVDAAVKLPLLRDTLALLNIQPRHRRELARRTSQIAQFRLYGDTFDSTQRTKAAHEDADSDYEDGSVHAQQEQHVSSNIPLISNISTSSSKEEMSCHAYFASLTAEWAWSNHLQAEERNLGGFDLVYPTDVYKSQPTAGLQSVYDSLLRISQEISKNSSS